MGYTISVEVNSERQAHKISNTLDKIITNVINDLSVIKTFRITRNSEDHAYAPDFLEHGVYLSFSVLDRGIHKSVWNIFQSIAQELDTEMYYDDEYIDIYKDDIKWKLKIYSDNFFMKWLTWYFNRDYNKTIKKFEKEYNKKIKPLL